jgi:hypothetical protein
MQVAPMQAMARSHLDWSGTKRSHLGGNAFDFTPEFAHFPISSREILGPGPRFALGDNLPVRAISLHASL